VATPVSVLVSVPYWRTPGTVRRAVESALAQTHRDLLCVVLNDGDSGAPPWPALDGVDDPRLVRHDLPANRGRYFADAVAARAAVGWCEWWMPVDSDDHLDPGRLAALLAAAGTEVDVVMSGWTQHLPGGEVRLRPLRRPALGTPVRAVAHLSSLWRPAFAAALANPGERMAWDQVMTTAAWTFGRVAVADDAGYHRVVREGSLMRSRTHGKGTRVRRAAKRRQRRLWREMRTGPDLAAASAVLSDHLDRATVRQVAHEAARLREVLEVVR